MSWYLKNSRSWYLKNTNLSISARHINSTKKNTNTNEDQSQDSNDDELPGFITNQRKKTLDSEIQNVNNNEIIEIGDDINEGKKKIKIRIKNNYLYAILTKFFIIYCKEILTKPQKRKYRSMIIHPNELEAKNLIIKLNLLIILNSKHQEGKK